MSSIFESPFPDEVDPRIEGFTAMVQRYLAHSKSSNQKKDHCHDCTWTLSRLEILQKMTAEYAEMRKTDDDLIEWNTLILELVNKNEQIASPPKRSRVVEKDPLMAEQEAKAAETAAFWEDDRIEIDFDDASEENEDEEEDQMNQDEEEQENQEEESNDIKTD